MRGLQPQSHMTFQYRGHAADEKRNYLHFYKAHGCQTWQGGDSG